MVATVHSSIEGALLRALFGIMITIPVLLITGPLFIIQLLSGYRRGSGLPSYVVYGACLTSVVIQYLFFSEFGDS